MKVGTGGGAITHSHDYGTVVDIDKMYQRSGESSTYPAEQCQRANPCCATSSVCRSILSRGLLLFLATVARRHDMTRTCTSSFVMWYKTLHYWSKRQQLLIADVVLCFVVAVLTGTQQQQ